MNEVTSSLPGQVYESERDVDALRRQLFAAIGKPSYPALLEQLAVEQERLADLRLKLAQRPADSFLLGRGTTGIAVKPKLHMTHVPSSIVHLLDPEETPLITVGLELGERRDDALVRCTAFIDGYSARAVDTVEVVPADPSSVSLFPTFFPDRLRTITEITRASLHLEIDDLWGGGGRQGDAPRPELHRSYPIWLLPNTSYQRYIQGDDGKSKRVSQYLAAWVTPNAPEVMRLLRAAAGKHSDKKMSGYQAGAKNVEAQARAIFEALQEEGIVYVSSVLACGSTQDQFLQRVRTPRESIARKSANCIDGTVLFASVLEAASLSPAIVLLPGHAIVAWQTQKGASSPWSYLETTLIGSGTFEEARKAGEDQAAMNQKKAGLLSGKWDNYYFDRLSIPELRAQRIYPSE